MSAGEPLGGPEGGPPSPTAAVRQSEAAQNPLADGIDTEESGEEAGGAQTAGRSGGSPAGGDGPQPDECGDASACHDGPEPWAAADGGPAAAAEHLEALQLGGGEADGGSGDAPRAGEATADAAGGYDSPEEGEGGAELEAATEGEADAEGEDDSEQVEEGSGTIKAHGGPASAPRLGASSAGPAKVRLSGHASSASTASRASKRLTFSAPPKCLLNGPRLAPRANFSHSSQRVRQILRDNAALVKRLGAIAFKQPEHELSQQQHDQFMANVSASSEKRREQEARAVERSNLAIYKRLQAVKPSRGVARASLDRDFAKHERMLATLAALRRRSRATSQPRASSGSRKSTQSGGDCDARPPPASGRRSEGSRRRAVVQCEAGWEAWA